MIKIANKYNDNSSQIIEDIKHFMFHNGVVENVKNQFNFSHGLKFNTWIGDGHSFIVKDADGQEYRVQVTKEEE